MQILSEEAEERLSESPLDYALVATRDDVYNALVCARLGPELGRERVFQLPAAGDLDLQHELDRDWRGKLFGRLRFSDYERLHAEGWRFTVVPTDEVLADTHEKAGLVFVRGGKVVFDSREQEDATGIAHGVAVVVMPPDKLRDPEAPGRDPARLGRASSR